MPSQPSHTTIIMGIVLAGAWTVLAYCLGAILPGLQEVSAPSSALATERRPGGIPIRPSAIDPCTGRPINVEAWLTIDVSQEGEAGDTYADAEVRLEISQGAPPIERMDPVIRHLSIFKAPLTSPWFVQTITIRTPLAGRLSFLELVIDLVAGATHMGPVSLALSGARIETMPVYESLHVCA